MGRRLTGFGSNVADSQNIILITLKRPGASNGGGIGIVLIGRTDFENNQIKVTHYTLRYKRSAVFNLLSFSS